MSRRSFWLAALGSAIALCGALAALAVARPIYVQTGDLEISFNVTIKPRTLPASRQAPIAPHLISRLRSLSGAAVPPITRATILIDRTVAIDSRGVGRCTAGQLESQTTAGAEAACSDAIVAVGEASIGISLPGQPPFETRSQLLALNGGVTGSSATIFIHAFLPAPITEAVVVPIVVSKLPKGPFGLRAQINVPKIASGAGSLTRFDLTFKRQVATTGGAKHGYLTGRCSDGNFVFEPTVEFADGNLARGVLALGCNPAR